MLIQRNIELAKKHVMVPPKSLRTILIIITVVFMLPGIILGSMYFGLVLLFVAPILVGLFLGVYMPVYRRSKAIVKMIEAGDLLAALNALTAMSAGSVPVITIYSTHYGAAKGYLEQALALISSAESDK